MLPPGKATKREHLESVERQTGKRPGALDGPQLPLVLAHLWEYWSDLNLGRGYGDMGAQPLSYRDLAAWSTIKQIDNLSSLEMDVVLAIDREWFVARAAQQKT